MRALYSAAIALIGLVGILLVISQLKDGADPFRGLLPEAEGLAPSVFELSIPTPAPPPPPADPSATVARVNGTPIDANSVRTEMVRHGADFLSQFGKFEEKEAVLEDLVRIQVLSQTARDAGWEEDQQVRDLFNRLLAERFWSHEMARVEIPPVTEDEARAYYDANPGRYTETLRVRGRAIELRVPHDAGRAARAEIKARAQHVASEAKDASDARFAALVREYSDDLSTRDRAGDMGFIAEGASVFRYEPAVLDALFSIEKIGGVSSIIETSRALVLVRLTDRLGGELAPFELVEQGIRRAIALERRREVEASRYAAMREQFEIEIDRDLLGTLGPTDLAAKSRPPAFPLGDSIR